MFNLLVSGNRDWWERPPLKMFVERFKEYSDVEGDAISADNPESLGVLEALPTLLMYEVGVGGPNARLVRHGRLQNLRRRGGELVFDFTPDPQRAYVDRGIILEFSDQLGMHRFEQHRTHWAIKDGELPPGLFDTAVAELPQRTVAVVAAQYIGAKRAGNAWEVQELENELEGFPPSLEKALSLLPAKLLSQATPEIYPLQGVAPGTAEARTAVEEVLTRDLVNHPPYGWSFSLAWFLSEYGAPTEARDCARAIEDCRFQLQELARAPVGGETRSVEAITEALWQCARNSVLSLNLRREIATLIDGLSSRMTQAGCWEEPGQNLEHVTTIRGTALATVVLQRLGDDRHHPSIGRSVAWLIEHRRQEDGAWPKREGDDAPDVVATIAALEAIRRSKLAADVPHVLAAGEAWLVSAQTVLGEWSGAPWLEDYVVAAVLDYLQRRRGILPQVDGFLLMARDFFRKAEELRLEGGANNRRMAAIATVHAVEMFLYGVFEQREDLALSPFRENGAETLGPREALRALQDSLQRVGVLPHPRRLKHRDQLSSLIGHRDGIIHRANDISEAELEAGMQNARKFIETYGPSLIKLDILQ